MTKRCSKLFWQKVSLSVPNITTKFSFGILSKSELFFWNQINYMGIWKASTSIFYNYNPKMRVKSMLVLVIEPGPA